jgi:hypothetical protein
MATITNTVRWADNTEQLRRNLSQGIDTIDAMKKSVDRTVQSLGGTGLLAAANRTAAAIEQLGGVTKLTAAEQARANTLIEKAIAKYTALGQTAPTALRSLADATKQAGKESEGLTTRMVAAGAAVGTFVGHLAGNLFDRAVSGMADVVTGAFKMNASLETTTLKFTTLMGDSDQAAAHVKDLFEIAKKTPFETGPIIEASLKLQTFGGAALNTKANILLLGDASAATGAPIQDLGFWVGRMYAMLQGGKPFGEAAMRLQELAVLTPGARDKMEALQKSGASATAIFDVFKESLGGFTGAMEKQAATWEGVMSTFTDTVNMLIAGTLKPYFEVIRDLGAEANTALDGLGQSLETSADSAAKTKAQFVDFIRTGLEGTISAVSFVLVEFNAAQVVFRNVAQVVEGVALAFEYAALGVAKLLNIASFGKAFNDDITRINANIDGLLVSISKRGAAIQADKQAEQDWVAWGQKANAAVETLTSKIGLSTGALAVHGQAHDTTATHVQKLTAEQKKAAKAQERWNELLEEFASVGSTTQATLAGLDGAVLEGTKYYIARGFIVEKIAKLYDLTKEQVQAVATQMKFEQVATDLTTKAFGNQAIGMAKLVPRYGDLHEAITGVLDDTGLLTSRTFESGTAVMEFADQSAGAVHLTSEGLRGELGNLRTNTRSFGESLKGTMANVPQIMQQAFTGGGGMGGAIKALGTSMGSDLFGTGGAFAGATKLATKGLSKVFGDTMGKAFGAALPGIGALIGPGLELAFAGLKKLFGGPSAAEVKGRETIKAFEAQLASTLTATQKAEAGGQQWKMTAIAVRDAYQASGRSAAEADAAVKKLWDSSKLGAEATKAAIEEINAVLNDQKQDAADLQEAIQRYGFSIEQLGPAMQKQKLDDQAKQLLNDWRLLVGSGIAIVDVDTKMASSINDYLKLARQTGQEVPVAMKPILETMIENGQLMDDNGVAITDMGQIGVTWSETMTAGFDRVVSKLQELLEGLGLVPKALDNIPDHKDVTVTAHYDTESYARAEPSYAARGGLVTALGVQHFQWGGQVKNLWARGTDTVPAMLTPGELVLNSPQQRELAGMLTGGIAAAKQVVLNETINVHFDVHALDARDLDRMIDEEIMPRMTTTLEDRRRGYTARWRQALGTT